MKLWPVQGNAVSVEIIMLSSGSHDLVAANAIISAPCSHMPGRDC